MRRNGSKKRTFKLVMVEILAILLLLFLIFDKSEIEEKVINKIKINNIPNSVALLKYETDEVSEIAKIALAQEGDDYETYCDWWGWEERNEWCAVFVCWCATQAGYTADVDFIQSVGMNTELGHPNDTGAAAGCHARFHYSQGNYHTLQEGYLPKSGDLIYFDWENDNFGFLCMDHIGIVEKVENGKIYTIEGNRVDSKIGDENDIVRHCTYSVFDKAIIGFSTFPS